VSTAGSVLRDRRLLARAVAALVFANARYWLTVAPVVRAQLAHWQRRACAIPDPGLRELALASVRGEGFTAEVAAMLATAAPRAHRANAVRAIVALEVLYDYLDALTESPSEEDPDDGRELYEAFTDALATPLDADAGPHSDSYGSRADGGYLSELVTAVRAELSRLPATAAIAVVAQRGAARGAEAQILAHAAPRDSASLAERWAAREAAGSGLGWREFLAGAQASVLAIHALIAAAANPCTTPARAAEIDATYLRMSALSTILDSLIDYEYDVSAGNPVFIQHYEDREVIARSLASLVRDAAERARNLPDSAFHAMILTGVVAYYTSAATATSDLARPTTTRVHDELRPLITPTLALMRGWRAAKWLRRQLRRSRSHAQ